MQVPARIKEGVKNSVDIILLGNTYYYIFEGKLSDARKKAPKGDFKFISARELCSCREILKILYDGFSVRNNRFLSELHGNKPEILISYSLKNLSHSEKTMFGYALKGRKDDGLLSKLKGDAIGRNSIKIQEKHKEKMEEFLKHWKVEYKKRRVFEV